MKPSNRWLPEDPACIGMDLFRYSGWASGTCHLKNFDGFIIIGHFVDLGH